MSIIAILQSKRHPPMPIRKGVVWRCENAISCAPPRQEIASVRFNTKCRYHLSGVIVRSNCKILKLSGRSIIQIPIARYPL